MNKKKVSFDDNIQYYEYSQTESLINSNGKKNHFIDINSIYNSNINNKKKNEKKRIKYDSTNKNNNLIYQELNNNIIKNRPLTNYEIKKLINESNKSKFILWDDNKQKKLKNDMKELQLNIYGGMKNPYHLFNMF